jgi:hypothetical protein
MCQTKSQIKHLDDRIIMSDRAFLLLSSENFQTITNIDGSNEKKLIFSVIFGMKITTLKPNKIEENDVKYIGSKNKYKLRDLFTK